MFPQPAEFRDETETLHALVAPLDEAALAEATAFKRWTIADIVGHLHVWNRAADLALGEPAAFHEMNAEMRAVLAGGGTLRQFETRRLKGLGGRRLVEAWWRFAAEMAERFAAADPSLRVPWVGPAMSARSCVTARLMETWAHGQAIHDLLGAVRGNTDRIRNIAVLAVNAYGWSFKVRGETPPAPPPHLRLTAPSGAAWAWNAPSETDLIEGAAEEFCQVVTQVRNVADTRLALRGAAAQAWMANAQCFAGPPETPPAPGTRRRAAARPAWAK